MASIVVIVEQRLDFNGSLVLMLRLMLLVQLEAKRPPHFVVVQCIGLTCEFMRVESTAELELVTIAITMSAQDMYHLSCVAMR